MNIDSTLSIYNCGLQLMNDISYKEDILSHPGQPQAQLGREDFDHQEGLSLYLNILTKIKDL